MPFRSALYALLLLLVVVRPLVLTLDESLARSLLANPFPFNSRHRRRRLRAPRHIRPPLLRDWAKRVSRLGWHARSIWQRGRLPLLGLLLIGFLLLAVPINDLLSDFHTPQQERQQGWSVVAGRWLIRRIKVGAAETGSANSAWEAARGWKPLRNIVWLEVSQSRFGDPSPPHLFFFSSADRHPHTLYPGNLVPVLGNGAWLATRSWTSSHAYSTACFPS